MTSDTKTIRLDLEMEVAGEWPGDTAACEAALAHIPSSVIDLGESGALLIRSMTATSVPSGGWTHVAERVPTEEPGQVDVLFCSPGWACAISGLFSRFADGVIEWSEYDQQKDRYSAWDSDPPTLWMKRPAPPSSASVPRISKG